MTNHVAATWVQGMRFMVATGSGHALVVDNADHQDGAAAGPMELVLAATACCTGMDVVSILDKMRQKLERLEIGVEGLRREEEPRVYTEVVIVYRAWGEIDPEKLLRSVSLSETKYCSVVAMLKPSVKVLFRAELNGAPVSL